METEKDKSPTEFSSEESSSFRAHRDRAVSQVLEELRRRVRETDLTQRAIEEENGFARGYLSQVLQGKITLTVRHLVGVLLSMGVSPERFFADLFGPPEQPEPAGWQEIRQRLARYDAALQELEEKGILERWEVEDEDL